MKQERKEMEEVAAALLFKMATEGKTLKEAAGISDNLLEEIYSLAYTFYDQGKYKEALSLFQFLTSTASTNFNYILGAAASQHQLKNYEEAAYGFFIALNLNPENPLPAFYAADCFLQQGNKEGAIEFLHIAKEIAALDPHHSALKERCELMLSSSELKK